MSEAMKKAGDAGRSPRRRTSEEPGASKPGRISRTPERRPDAKAKAANRAATPKKPGVGKSKAGQARGKQTERDAKRRPGGSKDLFLEKKGKPTKRTGNGAARRSPDRRKHKSGGGSGKRSAALFGMLNACLLICIALLVALGVRQHREYERFLEMRGVVDRQTFYEGTTVEGVDVSRMTLSNAMDYWRDRVEPRYESRAAVLEGGETVTAAELGYASDYAAVLNAAWSAGRSGSLEQRYRTVTERRGKPVAYRVTRSDTRADLVEAYAQRVAAQVDQPAVNAAIASFDAENHEFVFTQSSPGVQLDTEALERDIVAAIAAGGGSVSLRTSEIPPQITTEEVAGQYGLISYAITNASSSSRARRNNIELAMSIINGTKVAPGETFSFNETVGERTTARGFRKATAYSGGDVTEQVGGGICQVSTTLFNAAVKADMEIVERHNHSLTVAYVDKGKDATVSWGNQDFRFRNTSTDDVYICCYLTEDRRVRFGIFGKLLPDGETITLDAVTTEVVKYETEYQASPLLGHGETYLLQPGRNGYKAEAYKVRWDANGNQLSRELLCKSVYQVKNEIIQYGA